jgi:hypothetical protein
MQRRTPRLLVAVYAVFGAYAVHALRYALDPVPAAAAGHGYLEGVPPLFAALLAMAAVRFAMAALDRRGAAGRALHWPARWLLATAAFLVLFALQENAEALLTAGHAAGPAALLGHGGWTVLPLATVAGGVLAALLRGTEHALERLWHAVAASTAAAPRPRGLLVLTPAVPAASAPPAAALARHLAGRAPPHA